METRSRSPSRSTKSELGLFLAALLIGCSARVIEEHDDFVEERCEIWCDGVSPCDFRDLSWEECFNSCVETEAWTESCLEPRAAYHDCLLRLSCAELEERTEAAIAGENGPHLACFEEDYEASICRDQ